MRSLEGWAGRTGRLVDLSSALLPILQTGGRMGSRQARTRLKGKTTCVSGGEGAGNARSDHLDRGKNAPGTERRRKRPGRRQAAPTAAGRSETAAAGPSVPGTARPTRGKWRE